MIFLNYPAKVKTAQREVTMSYQALYRKWRPDNFNDVKGQDTIVTTLRNQINADRIGHAYLFCGTRGTGKTSVAKIFAKAVNCEHPVDGNPCGECPTCKAIAAGTSMNVIEIDAASNNGNKRNLLQAVRICDFGVLCGHCGRYLRSLRNTGALFVLLVQLLN